MGKPPQNMYAIHFHTLYSYASWILEHGQSLSDIPQLHKKNFAISESKKELNPNQYFKEIRHLIGIKWLL